MEIRCEKCGQEEGQIKNGRRKAGSQRYRCKHCEKNVYPRKKRKDVSGKAKRPGNRTVYGRKQWKTCRTIAENKQEYVFEVDTAKS